MCFLFTKRIELNDTFFSGNGITPDTKYKCNKKAPHKVQCNLINPPDVQNIPLKAPANCVWDSFLQVVKILAPKFLKDLTSIPIFNEKSFSLLGVSASIQNAVIVGFNSLKIEEICAVQNKPMKLFYVAAKLPTLTAKAGLA